MKKADFGKRLSNVNIYGSKTPTVQPSVRISFEKYALMIQECVNRGCTLPQLWESITNEAIDKHQWALSTENKAIYDEIRNTRWPFAKSYAEPEQLGNGFDNEEAASAIQTRDDGRKIVISPGEKITITIE